MAFVLVAVLSATSLQDAELPYLIIIASRTVGGASARIFSASIDASAAEICEQDEDVSEEDLVDAADALVPALRAREDRLPALLELIVASEPFQSK